MVRDPKYLLRSALMLTPHLWSFGLDRRRRFNRLIKRPFDPTFRALQTFRPLKETAFIDVGANIGESIEAMRLYHPQISIVAFEPAAATFATLSKTVGHLPSVSLHQCALSDEPGSFTLYTPTANGVPLPALASAVYEDVTGWIDQFAGGLTKYTRVAIVEETVNVKTLDQMDLLPGFLKVDVQGFEARVLRGGMETLRRCMPLIMVEHSPNDGIPEMLGPLGYRAYRWDGKKLVEGLARNTFYLTDAYGQQLMA